MANGIINIVTVTVTMAMVIVAMAITITDTAMATEEDAVLPADHNMVAMMVMMTTTT